MTTGTDNGDDVSTIINEVERKRLTGLSQVGWEEEAQVMRQGILQMLEIAQSALESTDGARLPAPSGG